VCVRVEKGGCAGGSGFFALLFSFFHQDILDIDLLRNRMGISGFLTIADDGGFGWGAV